MSDKKSDLILPHQPMQRAPTPDNPVAQLLDAARSGANADQLMQLADVMFRFEKHKAHLSYISAMRQVQGKVTVIKADAYNKQTDSMYTLYETLHRVLAPVYTVNGFTLSFSEDKAEKPDEIRIVVKVSHVDGHVETHWLDGPIDNVGPKGTPNKTPLHGKVSSVSYLRRMLEGMVFGVVASGQDDDGNAGGGDPVAVITSDQAADLKALCSEVGADEERFLKWLRVESWETIPEHWHEAAVRALEAKRSQQ